ncbi:MAG: YkvA family protein [Actinomycetota bacterium]
MEGKEQLDRVRGLLASAGKLVLGLLRDPRVPSRHKLILAGVSAYVVLPFDFIPDWIPGLGQVDDLMLLAQALDLLLNRLPEDVVAEHWDGSPEILTLIRKGLSGATMFVPAWLKNWMLPKEPA